MMNIKRLRSDKNYGIDRISSLPDDVLTHILSFLSTRKAVQTCILSKRWRNTWASVPILEFDIKEFGLPKIVDDEMAVEFVTKFELLVKSVLEKRETSCSVINRFQFWLDSGINWPCIQAVADCIGNVMEFKPRECSVKLRSHANFNVETDLIFTCASLIDLQLCLYTNLHHTVVAIIEPNSVNLPCLKTLDLTGCAIISDSFLKKLLLGCPVLEELVLSWPVGIIEICSNTLKKLIIHEGGTSQISTPNLLYFEIYVFSMGKLLLLNMPSLVDAFLDIPGWFDEYDYIPGVPKLIASFSNLESLKLQYDCTEEEVLKKEFSNCPIFNNLKRLELLSWSFYIFGLVPFFLHHSPKLQELTLKNIYASIMKYLDEKTTQERDALVQREFLKTVRIIGFKNDNGFVDWLINKLFAHVKIIGEIIRV